MNFMRQAVLAAMTLTPAAGAFAQTAASPATEVVPVSSTSDGLARVGTKVDNQVGLHLFSLFFNQLNVEYERRLTPTWSALIAPKIGLGALSNGEVSRIFGRSVGVEVGGRWFAAAQALKGFYLQPTASFQYYYPKGGSAQRLGLHGKAGHQWVIGDRAFINLSGGVMYNAEWSKNAVGLEGWEASAKHSRGFMPDLSFAIGVGF